MRNENDIHMDDEDCPRSDEEFPVTTTTMSTAVSVAHLPNGSAFFSMHGNNNELPNPGFTPLATMPSFPCIHNSKSNIFEHIGNSNNNNNNSFYLPLNGSERSAYFLQQPLSFKDKNQICSYAVSTFSDFLLQQQQQQQERRRVNQHCQQQQNYCQHQIACSSSRSDSGSSTHSCNKQSNELMFLCTSKS